MGISFLVETRDGSGEHRDRHRRPHIVQAPPTMRRYKIRATFLSAWMVVAAYRPIFEALKRGEQVLIHCLNGRHRSTKTVTDIVGAELEECCDSGRLVRTMRVFRGWSTPGVTAKRRQTHILQATLAEHLRTQRRP
jgi:hypothetical protein